MNSSKVLAEIKNSVSESFNAISEKVVQILYDKFSHYDWVGIYLIQGKDLILNAWKGKQPTEHTKIPAGKGICGVAAVSGQTEVISDVSSDSRYLACFLSTKSEIVVSIKKGGKVVGEIDIDSDTLDAFTEEDKNFLEKVAGLLSKFF